MFEKTLLTSNLVTTAQKDHCSEHKHATVITHSGHNGPRDHDTVITGQ